MGRPKPAKARGVARRRAKLEPLDQPRNPAQLRSPHQPARNHQPTPKQGKR
jgi:hypothetical protein